MGLETHSKNGLAAAWMAENLQPHTKEKQWSGLLTMCRVQRYILLPTTVNPGCRQPHRWSQNRCYTLGYGVSSSAENSQKVSIFFRQL